MRCSKCDYVLLAVSVTICPLQHDQGSVTINPKTSFALGCMIAHTRSLVAAVHEGPHAKTGRTLVSAPEFSVGIQSTHKKLLFAAESLYKARRALVVAQNSAEMDFYNSDADFDGPARTVRRQFCETFRDTTIDLLEKTSKITICLRLSARTFPLLRYRSYGSRAP